MNGAQHSVICEMNISTANTKVTLLTRFFAVWLMMFVLFQAHDARAAGAVEMQVERIVKIAIMEYNSAMRSGDSARWVKYFTDNVKRKSPQSTQEGKQAFEEYFAWEFANFDATWTTKRMLVSGRSGAVEYEWDAVHKSTGTPLKLNIVVILEMASSGKFEAADFYFDTAKYGEYFAGAPGTN